MASVIIPVYNGGRFIRETIESALAQTCESIEVVVVDDGSTDDSATVVSDVARKDSRVRLISQENRGVAAARNTGIANARGKYIAPLDADDIWHPEKIQAQVEAIESADSRVGLVYAWSAAIDADGECLGGVSAHNARDMVFPVLLFSNIVGNGSAPLIRRECLDAVGGYSEAFAERNITGCEDIDLYLRIAEEYRYLVVERILIGYRHHAGNMSGDDKRMSRSFMFTLQRLADRMGSLPKQFIRKSRAFNQLYLERVAAKQGNHAGSLRHVIFALMLDPGLILETRYVRLFCMRLIRVTVNLLPGRFRNRRNAPDRRNVDTATRLTFEELEARAIKSRQGWLQSRKAPQVQAVAEWFAASKRDRFWSEG